MAFIEHRFADDPTNWWVPNRAAVEAMLRSSGFAIDRRLEEETYLCRAGQPGHHEYQRADHSELDAALGRHTSRRQG